MTQLNKSLNSFSSESGYNEQIDLLHTEDRAIMNEKDGQGISPVFNDLLSYEFHKVRSKFTVLNETENLKARLYGMLCFSTIFRKTGYSQ